MTDLKQLRVNAENSQPGTFWGHVATPMTVIDLIDRIEALERENAELRKQLNQPTQTPMEWDGPSGWNGR